MDVCRITESSRKEVIKRRKRGNVDPPHKHSNIMSAETRTQRLASDVADGVIMAGTRVSSASVSCIDVVSVDQKVSDRDLEAAKKASFLGEGPLGRTIWSLTWPDLVGKIVQALYVMVDAIYIGNMAGNNQRERSLSLAACTLVMPIDQFFHISMALLIGVGTSAIYGQNLGRGDSRTARRVIGNMYVMCVIVGIIYPLIAFWFRDPLLRLAGASEEAGTLDLARQYFTPLLFGDIITNFACAHNNSIRGEGNSFFSACCMFVGGIVNIIMDPILIRVTGNSIRGAAFATLLGNTISSVMGITYYFGKHGAVVLEWKDFKPSWSIMKTIMSVGISGAISSASGSVVSLLMNKLLLKYSAMNFNSLQVNEILAVVGACGKFSFFCFMPMMALAHGCLPIYSYCYGAKKFSRFQATMKIQFFAEVIVSVILMLAGAFLGNVIAGMFSSSIFFHKVFTEALRYTTSGLFANAITMAVFPALQACGRGLASATILFMKQLIFLLAFAQIFCALLKDWWGNMYSYPLAEICGAILSTIGFFIYKDVFQGKRN